jgi:hypothetical protein
MEDNIHLLNYEQRQLKNRLKENEADIDRQTEAFYTEKHYNKYVDGVGILFLIKNRYDCFARLILSYI